MLKQLQKATGILLVLCALFGSLVASAQNRAISGKVLAVEGPLVSQVQIRVEKDEEDS